MDPLSEAEEPLLQACPACGAEIDVSDEEPLAAILCPQCGAPSVVASTIDHFELQDVIGRGGMGVVYKALDTSLNRPVALKLLRKSECANTEQIAQLETEAAITASINHPYVVKVFTTGSALGRFYIAMELVDKGTLDDLIELQGRIAEAQTLQVGIQIASGLRAAWQAGLIHRDVKPGNILFADSHTAKIVDFGLAIFMEDEEKARGEIWGTPYYVAPEKLDNKPEDFRSDIYSLGGTLFHALAGRPPFEAEDASLVALKHLKSQAVSLQAFAPHVSGATAYVINRTLSKDPEQRYQSYDELIEHLEYALNELASNAAKPAQAKRVVLETEEDKKAVGWIVFAMIGIIVAALVAGFLYRDKLFPGAPAVDPEEQKAEAISNMFPDEIAALADGRAVEAAAGFRAAAATHLRQPKLNWANLLEGLSELAAGRHAQALAAFKKIEQRGPYESKMKSALPDFFVDAAREMQIEAPTEPAMLQGLDLTTHQAILPLLYGVKNWELGKVEQAIALLRQVRQSAPAGRDAWIDKLKPLAMMYLEEFNTFEVSAAHLKAARNDGERKTAIAELARIKGKLAPRAQVLIASASAKR